MKINKFLPGTNSLVMSYQEAVQYLEANGFAYVQVEDDVAASVRTRIWNAIQQVIDNDSDPMKPISHVTCALDKWEPLIGNVPEIGDSLDQYLVNTEAVMIMFSRYYDHLWLLLSDQLINTGLSIIDCFLIPYPECQYAIVITHEDAYGPYLLAL